MLDRRASQVLRDVPRTEPLVALALVANAAALVVNSLLGQLAMGVVTHPFSKTLVNQTMVWRPSHSSSCCGVSGRSSSP